MSSDAPSPHSRIGSVPWIWQVAVLAVLYVVAGRIGLELAHIQDNATLVWPPTGLALGALILFGRSLWPGVFLGLLLLNATQASVLELVPSLAVAAGNSVEAVIGATLLARVGFDSGFGRPRDVGAFLLIGVVGCTTISATVGTYTLLLSGAIASADFGPVFLVWWLGDLGGAIILTPPILLLLRGSPSWSSLFRRIEFWLCLTLLLGSGAFTFLAPLPNRLGALVLLPCFPILVWAGTRLGSRGAMVASFTIVTSATLATVLGLGPLATGDPTDDAILTWAFATVVGLAGFALAAVVQERDVADRRYRVEEVERARVEKQRLLLLERERLTREMHDGLGGQLVSTLSMVERGQGTPAEVAESLRRALDDIRIVIDSLDPDTTDLPTSLGKLRARLAPLLKRNGMTLAWQIDAVDGLRDFPPEASLHVLRVIQEAVTNAMRHSGGSSVEVRVEPASHGRRAIHLCIRDDGCGLGTGGARGGRGVENMRTRAEELGGALRLGDANPGTRIDLEVPLPPGAGASVSPSARS